MSAMNRRTFLGLSGGAAVAGVFGGLALPGAAGALPGVAGALQPLTASTANRTLVVVDLQGGNDALNTLVPQTGLYRDLRPTIGVAEADLLSFNGLGYGVHPGLGVF